MTSRFALRLFPFASLALLSLVPACLCSRVSETTATDPGAAGAAGAQAATLASTQARTRVVASPSSSYARPSVLRNVRLPPPGGAAGGPAH